MTRTRLSFALGLSLLAAGCPGAPPAASTTPGESLGSPEAGSTSKKGAPVAPPADTPAAPPADKAADTPAAPADKPAETPTAPPAEAPKNP
jgi:hypothetical protein